MTSAGAAATVPAGSAPAGAETAGEHEGVWPAALAAFAESGVLFLPLSLTLSESAARATAGPLATYPAFVALFTLWVAGATRVRRSRAFVPVVLAVAIGAGLAQGLWWAKGGAGGVVLAVGLSLAVAIRAVTLALRDWRDPVQASFGWGAGAALVEAVIRPDPAWTALAPAVVAQFFAGSLASRSASLRLAEAEVPAGGDARGRTGSLFTTRGAMFFLIAGVVLAGLAALLGGVGGTLARLGRFIPLALYGVVYGATFLLAQILRPVGWVLKQLGFHGRGPADVFRRLAGTLRGLGRASSQAAAGRSTLLYRLFGFLLTGAFLAVLVSLILRQRRRWALVWRELPEREEPRAIEKEVVERPARRGRRPRRELPEDAVRRLYAETLLALERRGLPRPGPATPGEHLDFVRGSVPGAEGSLTALTRAYEDVRYGLRTMDSGAVDRLTAHRDIVLEALRRNPQRPAERNPPAAR